MKTIPLNLNDKVLIRLTPVGREILAKDAASGAPVGYTPSPTDREGWSRWTPWEVMLAFGKHMGNGFPVPFETNMRVIEYTP